MKIASDQKERDQATKINGFKLVCSPAGSGKTKILVSYMMKALAVVPDPTHVHAITFTNLATSEMKTRILEVLRRGLDDNPPTEKHEYDDWVQARIVLEQDRKHNWNLLLNPSQLNISTFDGFCRTLASRLPILSRMGGPVNIEEHPHLLYEHAVQMLLEDVDNENIEPRSRQAIENLLRFAQNQTHRLTPMLCNLLSCRDQWSMKLYNSDSLQMEEAIKELIVTKLEIAHEALQEIDMPSVCQYMREASVESEQLAWAADLSDIPPAESESLELWRQLANTLMTKLNDQGSRTNLRKSLNKTCGFAAGKDYTKGINEVIKSVHDTGCAGKISKALYQVQLLPDPEYPDELSEFREDIRIALTRLLGMLKLSFEINGKVDFIEIAERALKTLGDMDNVTDTLMQLDYSISHILVDEIQDTSQTQFQILKKLTQEWEPEDGRTLLGVGDEQQSIYRFRQAEVRQLSELRETKQFNNRLLEVIELSNNFRSDDVVINWFNTAFSHAFPEKTDLHTGAVTFSPSVAFNDKSQGSVTLHPRHTNDDVLEGLQVAEIIESHQKTDPDQKIAVLVRSRSHLKQIIPALKDAGIRYTATEIDPIDKRAAVNDVIHMIYALRHPLDNVHWVGLLRSRFVGISFHDILIISRCRPKNYSYFDKLQYAIENDLLEGDGRIRASKLVSALKTILEDPKQANQFNLRVRALWYGLYGEQHCTPEEYRDVQILFSRMDEHCQNGQLNNIPAFLASLNGLYATTEQTNVELMTIHKSKGLEFDVVIMPSLSKQSGNNEEELFQFCVQPKGYVIAPNPGRSASPDSQKYRLHRMVKNINNESDKQEQRRVLYVGITRCRKHLHLLGHCNTSSTGMAYANKDTMLDMLWPVVKDSFELSKNNPVVTTDNTLNMPWIPTILKSVTDTDFQTAKAVYIPPFDNADIVDENVSSKGDGDQAVSETTSARAVGIVYHLLAQRITQMGLDSWKQLDREKISLYIKTKLASAGLAQDELNEATSNVTDLVENSITSQNGNYILKKHAECYSEWQITGYLEKEWVTGVIDRAIREDDGTLHIIDYKTSGKTINDDSIYTYINEQKKMYQSQMHKYERLLTEKGEKSIKLSLYFPEIDMLCDIDSYYKIQAA